MSARLGIEVFAEHLERLGHTSDEETLEAARRCLVDALGCAASGITAGSYPVHIAAARDLLGTERREARIWFSGRQAGLLEAAYLNSVAVSADDLDDGNRSAVGHPGGAVVPAVLAVADYLHFTGDLRPAIAVGYEAGVVLATARRVDQVPTMATGRWAAMAVAAAAAVLSGWDASRIAEVIAHAGSLSPQLVHPDMRATDGLKEGTPWAVVAGLMAWRLTAARMPAPLQLLERQPEFIDRIPAPEARPAITQTYFKRYACCRWIHPVLDLFFEHPSLRDLDPDTIEQIEVVTFDRGLTLSNSPAPDAVEDAHYSFPFCTALAVLGTPADFLPLKAESLHRPDVRALAHRVRLTAEPRLSAAFPAKTPARVLVRTRDGEIGLEALTARGDPSLPLTDEELAAKQSVLRHAAGIPTTAEIPSSGPISADTLAPLLTAPALERYAS